MHLGTASVIEFSGAGGDQCPMGDVVVIAAFGVSVGDGVPKSHIDHFGDHNMDRTGADMLGYKEDVGQFKGVVMALITQTHRNRHLR